MSSTEIHHNIHTYKLEISGIVQGVGFRPFIYRLAHRFELRGYVFNHSNGVTIEVQGTPQNYGKFVKQLKHSPPPRSSIDTIQIKPIKSKRKYKGFSIKTSETSHAKQVPVSPDLDLCSDCAAELLNPGDRRYLYPFINCTNCGPRFTIIKDIPYDRKNTTMVSFAMCDDCQKEYLNPLDRRFHAQPNACPVCGPQTALYDQKKQLLLKGGHYSDNKRIFEKAADLLARGHILALKGIGGFHLACDATQEGAVSALRQRKVREDKPFALMCADTDQVQKLCQVSSAERQLLESHQHPIVLLNKKPDNPVAFAVAPHNHCLGIMLPYSPIHHLLLYYFPNPLVMTSGNTSDEPIAYQNEMAFRQLNAIADYFLMHNRDIHIRCDDSVYRIWRNRSYPLRRSRGYAPASMITDWHFNKPVLATGPEQKNTFALAKSNRVFLSHHIGDMENYTVLKAYETSIEHYMHIFDVVPQIIAYDQHPGYLSTQHAIKYADLHHLPKVAVQHHHAHAVACMAENKIQQPVIAITLDGTGMGPDHTIWGGEILLAEYAKFERLGHFQPVRMPGGKAAILHPWQMAVSYLLEVYGDQLNQLDLPFLNAPIEKGLLGLVIKIADKGINSPFTSSCGRLFDGIAAIAGIRNSVNYEGQAAVEFEQSIQKSIRDGYSFSLKESQNSFIIQWDEMVKKVVRDVQKNKSKSFIAAKFHNGLARILVKSALKARELTGLNRVVLSGGVFMNIYLLDRLYQYLEDEGFKVFTHHQTPTNDGGIALGQALIASAQLKEN